MARVLCGISGIEFTVEHLNISLQSREYAHPVFFIPQKKLLSLYSLYQKGEMPSTDAYLSFLAYLNSTDLVEWRTPAKRTNLTDSIIAQNFESLVSIIEKMNAIRNYSEYFNHLAITPDTSTLTNIDMWIASWEQTYEDFLSGYAQDRKRAELGDIEERLERILYSGTEIKEIKFASKLAEWADKAGSFPRFPVSIGSNTIIPCNEYWKSIIRKCHSAESIFSVPSADLEELISHCEEYIEVGSTFGHHLFESLRQGQKSQSNFLGLGDFQFSIVSADTSVETANKLSIVQNAPTELPQRINYPSQFAYIKAKLAYDMMIESKSGESK